MHVGYPHSESKSFALAFFLRFADPGVAAAVAPRRRLLVGLAPPMVSLERNWLDFKQPDGKLASKIIETKQLTK